jgi:hypothetical protein
MYPVVVSSAMPVQVPGSEWASVSVGNSVPGNPDLFQGRSACATTTTGELWCWGSIAGFAAGGAIIETESPTPIHIGGTWASVSVGPDTCATGADGSLWCGGFSGCTLAPDQTVAACAGFTTQIPGMDWASVAVSVSRTCALETDHTLWCWQAAGAPAQVPGSWAAVSTGGSTCATKLDGSVWCWGANGYGQLGDGSAWKPAPAQMSF